MNSEKPLNSALESFLKLDAENAARQPEPEPRLACGLTKVEILQLKRAGIDKPAWITPAEWYGPLTINHRHMLVAHLAALGYRIKDIAHATRISENRVSILINSENVQEQIKLIRENELRGLSVEQSLAKLSSHAVRVYEDILMNPDEKSTLKQRTAADILDRKLGKPKQQIELGGTMIRDFYELLKNQSVEIIDAEPAEISEGELVPAAALPPGAAPEPEAATPEASESSIDSWLDQEFQK